MNNIHEKDWADDLWYGHTGMDCFSAYCFLDEESEDQGFLKLEGVTKNSKNT